MSFLSQHVSLILVGLPLFVFAGMLVLFGIGQRLGLRHAARDPEGAAVGLGPVKAAIYALLGLLIAFTFGGAMTRFDKRRDQVVSEALAIGNAWDRLAALPQETRRPIQAELRLYVESRLETYRRVPDLDAVMEELRRSREIRDELWREAVAACATEHLQRVTLLVLPALETALDASEVRTAAAMHHPPLIIWVMLFLLCLVSALLAGYGVTRRSRSSWVYIGAFAVAMAITVYATLEIEFPRTGLVRIDASDQALTEVLERMK
jgi:hypothetical protein